MHTTVAGQWQQIVGHEWAVQLLHGAIIHDRVGHAYLLTGPAAIGKTTLARTFAQALNCTAEEDTRPCGNCRACRLIGTDRHPDVRVVNPEVSGRGKRSLKIDQVRELQQGLSLAAYEARTKVAILRHFDAATLGAANAFLKTLEEPPANVVLILTANEADTLLPTITSRCRTVGLRPLPADLIESSLATRWGIPVTQAQFLAHLADGRLGWAVRAASEPAVLQERQERLDLLQQILEKGRAGRFQLADKLARKSDEVPDLLQQWLSWWRDLARLAQVQRGNGEAIRLAVTNSDFHERLRHLAHVWHAQEVLVSLRQTDLALWQLRHNANTRLVLENLFLTYPLPVATDP